MERRHWLRHLDLPASENTRQEKRLRGPGLSVWCSGQWKLEAGFVGFRGATMKQGESSQTKME